MAVATPAMLPFPMAPASIVIIDCQGEISPGGAEASAWFCAGAATPCAANRQPNPNRRRWVNFNLKER
jgi:hypothetical protein